VHGLRLDLVNHVKFSCDVLCVTSDVHHGP